MITITLPDWFFIFLLIWIGLESVSTIIGLYIRYLNWQISKQEKIIAEYRNGKR